MLATVPTQEAVKPIDSVRMALEKLKPQMQLALPKHLTADRLVRVAMTAIQTTPALLECDRVSLYRAIITCAQLGLEPDGVLGQAYLVPFKGKVQFIPGYKGLIALARNSGEVVSIAAHEVREKDHFRYEFGLNEKLEHVPTMGERGEITHFYAVAKFIGGGHHFDVMTRAEVDAIRDKSAGWLAFKANKIRETPWAEPPAGNYPEMGKKTAIRRIAKYLPMNVQKAAAISEMYETGRHAELGDAGELIVEAEASKVLGDGRVVEAETNATSALDSFAGSDGPALFTAERRAWLVSQTEKALACSTADALATLDDLCGDIAGSSLEGTPASFEAEILKNVEKFGKARKR